MSNDAQYMPFYVGAYQADTAHLSTLAHGAYILLIMNYWQRGKPLPADERKLAAIARVSQEQWQEIAQDIAELFISDGDQWRHKRIDAEIDKATSKIAAARKAGKISAERRQHQSQTEFQQPFNDGSTDAEQSSSHKVRLGKEDTTLLNGRARELYDALRVTDETKTPGLLALSEPLQWLASGCDLDADVIPTLRQMAARGKRITSWAYCSRAVFEARDKRLAPAPPIEARGTSPPQHRNQGIIDSLAKIAQDDHERNRIG